MNTISLRMLFVFSLYLLQDMVEKTEKMILLRISKVHTFVLKVDKIFTLIFIGFFFFYYPIVSDYNQKVRQNEEVKAGTDYLSIWMKHPDAKKFIRENYKKFTPEFVVRCKKQGILDIQTEDNAIACSE